MSELDFHALREEAERATLPPEFTAVEQRLARVRRRRARYVASGVALGTIAALAVGFGLFRTDPGANPVDVDPAASPTRPDWPAEFVQPYVEFVDAKHGFATYANSPGEGCSITVRTTDDGGKTWSDLRSSPQFSRDRGCLSEVIDKDTIIAPTLDGTPFEKQHFISRDGGKTWREYEPAYREATTVPEGITPQQICLTLRECDQEYHDHLGWLEPGTGDHRVLTSRPSGLDNPGTPERAPDGSLWTLGCVVADDGETSLACGVAVSRDHGRTWKTTTIHDPKTRKPISGGRLWVGDGTVAYVLVNAYHGDAAILRTDDGGATWQRLSAETVPDGVVTGWVAADGTLVVGVSDNPMDVPGNRKRWYASEDGGRSFHRIDLPADLGPVRRLPGGGYLDQSPLPSWSSDPSRLQGHVSEDGLTWHAFTAPNIDD